MQLLLNLGLTLEDGAALRLERVGARLHPAAHLATQEAHTVNQYMQMYVYILNRRDQEAPDTPSSKCLVRLSDSPSRF